MHVCMEGMHVCVCVCLSLSLCLRVCLSARPSVCECVYVYVCMHVCMHACMHACMRKYLPLRSCLFIYLSVQMYILTHLLLIFIYTNGTTLKPAFGVEGGCMQAAQPGNASSKHEPTGSVVSYAWPNRRTLNGSSGLFCCHELQLQHHKPSPSKKPSVKKLYVR